MFKKIETISNVIFLVCMIFVAPGMWMNGYTIISNSADFWLKDRPLVIQQQIPEVHGTDEHVTRAQTEQALKSIFE